MRLPEWAERYISIPYEECDCWQLIQKIFAAEFGIIVGDVGDQRGNMRDRFWTPTESPREGDVVLFQNDILNKHVGVVLGVNKLMVHNIKGCNSCIESYGTNIWKHRVVGFYRHTDRCRVN